jgi:uncharacterized protein YycO
MAVRWRGRTERAKERGETAQAQRFGPGEAADTPRPGDFILTHGSSLMGRLIRVGQRLRLRGADRRYARWNHAALIVDDAGGLIEADEGGVHRAYLTKYAAVEYYLVRIQASDEARGHAVAFAEWSLREPFGWLTFISVALALLAGSRFDFGLDGQETCSGLVARALEHAGKILETAPSRAMPADLARQFAIEPPTPETPIDDLPALAAFPGRRETSPRGL